MAAVMRGGSHNAAKPRAKTAPKVHRRAPARRGQPAPAKLRAAQSLGLRPITATVIACLVFAAVLTVAMLTGDRLVRANAGALRGFSNEMAGLGFKVAAVHVQGASPQAQQDILKATGLYRDRPILGLDLGEMRARVNRVGWVKDARVVRLLPDTLVITVVERPAAAVWQFNRRTYVVDDHGTVIPEADPGRYARLPLVVGAGANEAAGQILPLVRSRPRLTDRLEALVRVDDRRWDVRLKDGGLIQLPAAGEESALIRLDQLDQSARVLELGFARIDLRDPELVAVRPREGGAPAGPEPMV